jgi:hypothetical protein
LHESVVTLARIREKLEIAHLIAKHNSISRDIGQRRLHIRGHVLARSSAKRPPGLENLVITRVALQQAQFGKLIVDEIARDVPRARLRNPWVVSKPHASSTAEHHENRAAEIFRPVLHTERKRQKQLHQKFRCPNR